MHHYQLYQLKVASAFLIKGLPETDPISLPDVVVKPGAVNRPSKTDKAGLEKPDSIAYQDCYFLELEGIARYLVKGNKKVIIEVLGTEEDAMVFFFDTILTVLLLRHNLFPFHGAAIKGKEGAIIISAHGGGGKSALAMSLMKKGYEFIEDDRCLLHWDKVDERIKIRNYIPFIDLWKDVSPFTEHIPKLKLLHPLRPNIQKYRYDASEVIMAGDIPVQKILCISISNLNREITHKEMTGIVKCRVAKAHTHLDHLIPYVSDPQVHFNYLYKTLSNVTVLRVKRSSLTKLPEFSNYIE